jgi:hypothetical protein
MSVVPLTLTVSLCLVFTFVLFFLREHSRRRFSSPESEALLPLADETPRIEGIGLTNDDVKLASSLQKPRDHVCRGNGSCNSCQRRAARQSVTATVSAASHQA